MKNNLNRYIIPLLVIVIILLTIGILYSNNFSLVKQRKVERYGNVIRVKPDKLGLYKKLHADPWPEVLKAIHKCNIRNFSIYYKDGYLFSYYEYVGNEYQADMKKLSELTKDWLKETDPCQEPVDSAKPGEWWSMMEEVFHTN
jgi:L-rhamnose mutarotase